MVLLLSCANNVQFHCPTSNNASERYADRKARRIEYLWQRLFSDRSQWWDNRLTKKSSREPDFKHKMTFEGLWIDSWQNPAWVKEKFAAMAFDPTQTSGKSTSRAPTSFVCLVRDCTRRKALAKGKQVHALIIKSKCDTNMFLSNLLIQMYSACGSVAEAHEVFAAMPQRNVFSWTAMISAYTKSRQYQEALALFQQMNQAGEEPDEVACIIALTACTNISALEQGQELHSLILKKGFDSNVKVRNTLINMYAKFGCLKDARELFDNMAERSVVSWTAMIAGYAQIGLGKEALDLYEQMKRDGMEPSNMTFVLLLKACASISALQQGKQLHSLILEKGLESGLIVQNALVDMYAKCGCLEDARELFDNMIERDVISWNVMITGYAQKGLAKQALDLYEQMKREGMEPDSITLVLLLKACASISALQQGKQLHSLILEKGLQSDLMIQNALLDMYAKCGCLKDARELFDNITHQDVISWNAMIAGYAQEGLGKEALDLLHQMEDKGLQPNDMTYSSVLSACSHSGLVDEGRRVFESMTKDHSVTLTLENYACMVDLLCRSGCLSDAEDLILKMPIVPGKTVWMSLLWSARKYANVEIGRRAFERIVKLEPDSASPYLLLKEIYSAAGRTDQIAGLTKEMNDKGLDNSVCMQLE